LTVSTRGSVVGGHESRDERGTVTLWVLGLCVALLFLGGLGLDLWRAVGARRALSSMADTAATAGANGLDTDALRAGTLRLDPARARAVAAGALARDPDFGHVEEADVRVDGNRVTVALRAHVDFSLLGIFLGGQRFDVQAHASARPEERP
jgi:Flp pilus assembly protein TadG